MASLPLTIESVNCASWALGLCVLILFGRYLYIEACWIAQRYRANGALEHSNRIQAATAIFVTILGEVTNRMWTWVLLFLQTSGRDASWLTRPPYSSIPIFGSFVTMVGMLCMVRVFTPDEWGNNGWVISGIIALIAAMAVIGVRVFEI